ncbi:MAG: hypothetical protein KAS23_04065 [Anaerohalosphaera sp.]|nr:hypothetical protein [Anaerohalosphaera sp.]
MLQLLKIASVLTVIAAIATVGIFGYYVYQGSTIPDVLTESGPSESIGKLPSPEGAEKMSPLVAQAMAFSLKIDPPVIIDPGATKGGSTLTNARGSGNPIDKPHIPNIPSRLKLIATCRYKNSPEKSLALIDMAAKGQEWFRQGENIEHLTLTEVKDGSVVLCQGDQFDSELFVPVEKMTSLLKSDQIDPAVAAVTGSPTGTRSAFRPGSRPTTQNQVLPAGRTRTPPPEPTLEEKKAIAERNLKGFQEIMNVSEMSPEDQKNMAEFLKVLENNMKNLDKDVPKSKAAPKKNKP